MPGPGCRLRQHQCANVPAGVHCRGRQGAEQQFEPDTCFLSCHSLLLASTSLLPVCASEALLREYCDFSKQERCIGDAMIGGCGAGGQAGRQAEFTPALSCSRSPQHGSRLLTLDSHICQLLPFNCLPWGPPI